MLIIPAIDLKEGRCVRLRQGRMSDDTVFSNDPLEMAQRWVAEGGRRLHLVDLDGAFAGEPRNAEVIGRIVDSCGDDVPIQVGGGIRSIKTAGAYLDVGVKFVIIGTQAVKQPEFVDELCTRFPGRIIVGLDAKEGLVATEGWAETSTLRAVDLAQRFEDVGVHSIIYTDISRDGMMQGVNVDATAELAEAVNMPVIASGGVSTIADVEALAARRSSGIAGVVVGRALYESTVDLREAQQRADVLVGRTSESAR